MHHFQPETARDHGSHDREARQAFALTSAMIRSLRASSSR